MNAQVLKKELINEIKEMPAKDVKSVADFVGFLKEQESDEDLITNKALIRKIKQSHKAWKQKKSGQFIAWEDLKKTLGL